MVFIHGGAFTIGFTQAATEVTDRPAARWRRPPAAGRRRYSAGRFAQARSIAA